MNIYNTQNIIPASTRMNATINSSAMQVVHEFGYSIQIVFTGTPTGTFKLQASSDYSFNQLGPSFTPTNWTDVTNSSQAVAAAGNVMWNVTDVMYNYVRVVYTDGSSAASTAIITSAVMNAKGV